ncbi:alpha/beta fold hydrolase [Belnapia moabensis]|uniref:alpha/beta fold hydrolase n=1 Tax=Belnapia moabensis TaxID=365533 RepID=UPI000A04CA0A|nr:alpha/beta hydrolase [Belnapia moabensis]
MTEFDAGKTYLLVHGSWVGGWFWAPVAERLRGMGHRVFAPTLTGLGERRHLLSLDVTLDTLVDDVVHVIGAEELQDIILIGHSFGGIPITGVADRLPESIRHLVYLDANIPESGRSFLDTLPPEVAETRRQAARAAGGRVPALPPPLAAIGALGVSEGSVADWLRRRMTPMPLAYYETPLTLNHPVGNGRPCTFVSFTNPASPPQESSRQWARGRAGWGWMELAVGHAAPVTAPDEVARLLAGIS